MVTASSERVENSLLQSDLPCLFSTSLVLFTKWTLMLGIITENYVPVFGGLGVACWPLVPKFAGSNPAEAVGFFNGEKNPQHAFLRRGSKAVGPMS